MIESVREQLLKTILEAGRAEANTILERWAETNGYDDAVISVLEPVLEKIGVIWENTQNISLAQAYVAGKIAEDFMAKVSEKYSGSSCYAAKKGSVVLGNIEDDYHSLGRRMVAIFLKSAGWEVYDLGNDVPAADFVDEAVKTGSRFIGVSAMMYTTAMNIKKVRTEIDRRGLTGRIKLIAGGAVFRLRRELVSEVGADATAGNAIAAPAVFDKLSREFNAAGGSI